MTDTASTALEELAREVAEYLRTHRPDVPPLRNQAGALVIPGQQATGRLNVNPGDEIQSVWGNTTYDQTMQVFASAADRDSQWATPLDGARCFLADTGTPWGRRGGVWHGIPMGFLISAVGPAAQTDVTAAAVVVSISVPVVAGRWYRSIGYANATQQTSTSTALRCYMTPSGALAATPFLFANNSQTAGNPSVGGTSIVWQAATTGTQTVTITASTTPGALRFVTNCCLLAVEDIGS